MSKNNIGFFSNIASILNPFEQVYAHSVAGKNELAVVDGYDEERIKKAFKELEMLSEKLANNVSAKGKSTLKQVKQILGNLNERGYQDLDLTRVSEIFGVLSKEIESLSNGVKVQIKNNDKPGGGVFHEVLVDGKSQGGIVLPLNDEKNNDIDGEYVSAENRENILSLLKNALGKINSLPRVSYKDVEGEISNVIIQNFDSLLNQCLKTSNSIINLPEIDRVTKRTRLKAVPAFLAGVVLAGAIALANPTKEFNVQSPDLGQFSVVDVIEDYDPTEITGKFMIAEQGALDELGYGIPLGYLDAERETIIGDSEPELIARKDAKEKSDSINEIVDEIEELKNNYSKIVSPTNEQWIELQKNILEKYSQILEVEKGVLTETNNNLNKHNEYNQIHLDVQPMTEEATQIHHDEIDANKEQINKNNDKINEKTKEQEELANKIVFYEKIQKISNLEEIENIEDVSETLYYFSKTDLGKSLSEDIFTELNIENINLYSAYTKMYVTNILDSKKVDENKFKKIYLMMQETYDDYTEKYGEIDVSKFAQFFAGSFDALDRYGDVEKDGFFDVIRALREESDLNRSLHEVETNTQETFWGKLKDRLDDWFNVERQSDYKNLLVELGVLDKDNPITQNGGEKDDEE